MRNNDIHEIDVLSHVYGGTAMGRLSDGRAVFVPGVLPGERVLIRLVENKRSFARAELVKVLQTSPDRVLPACPNASACGGCHYIHMKYSAQLRAKTEILRDQLHRIAGVDQPPIRPIIPSTNEWHYRNSVQFHINPSGKLGFQEPGTHKVVQVDSCLLCVPVIEEILPSLDFDGASGLDRIQIRAGAGDEIMLVFESNNPIAPELSVDLPVSVVFVGPGGFEENEPLVMAGDDHLIMEASGRAFRVSAGSFFQVNIPQAENMIHYLLDCISVTPDTHLLELYSGVGLFSAFLAPQVSRLSAVESSPSAVDDFVMNLDEFENVELFAGSAEEILPALNHIPDLVLVDPPRAGLSLPVIDALLRINAHSLVYVSCDPATLARDTKRLMAGGYVLQNTQPFDMFPQTYHIESISLFSRC